MLGAAVLGAAVDPKALDPKNPEPLGATVEPKALEPKPPVAGVALVVEENIDLLALELVALENGVENEPGCDPGNEEGPLRPLA